MTGESIGRGFMHIGDNLEVMESFPDSSVDVVFGSPPYESQRTYGTGFNLQGEDWVSFMIPRIIEQCRVSRGFAFVVMSSPTRDHCYTAAVEWLVADLTRYCGLVCGPSPYAWCKMEPGGDPNGIPGSGGKRYHRRDWEPIYSFAEPEKAKKAWTNNLAYGTPPKMTSFGGEFSNRSADGTRANAVDWKMPGETRRPTGEYKKVKRTIFRHAKDGTVKGGHDRDICKIANAGNVIRVPVGGSKLGHPIAHEGEAPFPLKLAERFVQWYCLPETGIILDPWMDTGSTAHAAEIHGRNWIGIDIREECLDRVRRRIASLPKLLEEQKKAEERVAAKKDGKPKLVPPPGWSQKDLYDYVDKMKEKA